MEERQTKLLFEGLDLLRDRRLRQQQLFRGPAEARVPGYGTEDEQAEVFDGRRGLYLILKNLTLQTIDFFSQWH
jgi:hypothetical protein